MKLKVNVLDVKTGGPLIVVIPKKEAIKQDLHPLNRVKLKYKNKEVIVVVDIIENSVKPNHMIIYKEVADLLGVKKNNLVELIYEPAPSSVEYILEKLKGEKLNCEKINTIIKDLLSNRLSEVELTYFIAACYPDKLSNDEIYCLTKAIVENGKKLNLGKKMVLDKHCIGGIPGNRTTMVVVPIIASLGYTIPKTSSRAISSPSGTADTMEALAKVEFTADEITKIIKKTNSCIAWGGAMNLAAADDKLIRLRHPLSLDPEGMLVASIMAKKLAVGSTHVLIDVPIGLKAKIQNLKQGKSLKKKFLMIAKKFNIKMRVVFTNGINPIGYGVGPVLEAKDVLETLRGEGPKDLREKSIELATKLLELVGHRNPKESVEYVLNSGLAYKKMCEIINAQDGKITDPNKLKVGEYKKEFYAERTGKINSFNMKTIKTIARIAGAPVDKGAGILLNVIINQEVVRGDKIFTIYSESQDKLKQAIWTLKYMKKLVEVK
ncbi:thymidine phosphorylase [Candidatus Woesearchaeota archaeon]|nr:thymidine phosphorylase [Candidatus Woesearchaeota archaeon]